MTSRLKRKLADLGVDINSRKANENFCLIGTPLPSLEKRDAGEYVPLWKQEVRDEKGRRRLHGAFTGGFSAGYFNTVGSKEGWTPSTFVSSRTDRAQQKASRPEDFMDDEDLQELKDSRTLVSDAEAMDLTGATQAELLRQTNDEFESDPVRGALLATLLPPPKESAGYKLLRKMGWKPGQGVGPRISYRQRKLEDMQATTTKHLTMADVVITPEEEEAAKHTYARRDNAVPVFQRKDDHHGLGYKSGLGLNETLGRSKTEAPGGPSISAGFGLGALNDAEEDDIDVYESGYNPGKTRVAFDISEHDHDTITLTQKKPRVEKKNEIRPTTVSAKFSNGLPVLPGFVLDDSPVVQDVWFPAPEVPEGWKPNPKRVWDSDPNKENIEAHAAKLKQPLPYHKWKTGMTAQERGALLGETPLSTTAQSEQPPEEFNNKELEDYAKAAAIFKPISGAMAGRFTSAAIIEHGPNMREGLHTPSAEEIENYEAEEKKRLEDKLTPQQNAAKLGMYGPLTREVQPWQPARLLSKRFGVKEPETQPDADPGAGADVPTEKSWQEQAGMSVPVSKQQDVAAPSRKRDLNNVGLGEDETQGIDTLTYERPSMDIFKAIFASDDESGEEEEEEEEEAKEEDEEEDVEKEKDDVTAKFFPESNGVKDVKEQKGDGPVDLNTFKPTFIPRDRKSKSSKGKDKDSKEKKDKDSTEKKKKKDKKDKDKKKDKKTLVSFEVDEEGGGLTFSSKSSKGKDRDKDKDRPKKKRKVKEHQEGGDEEIPTADAIKALQSNTTAETCKAAETLQRPTTAAGVLKADVPSVNQGRKRAIDFM